MGERRLSRQDRIILDDGQKAEWVLFAIFFINGLILLAVFALVISGGA